MSPDEPRKPDKPELWVRTDAQVAAEIDSDGTITDV